MQVVSRDSQGRLHVLLYDVDGSKSINEFMLEEGLAKLPNFDKRSSEVPSPEVKELLEQAQVQYNLFTECKSNLFVFAFLLGVTLHFLLFID